jgi:integrase
VKLTAKKVAACARRPGRYADGHNLYLVVVNASNASWQLRFRYGGRERYMGLGPLHTVSLAEARERAKMARLKLLDGVDPLEARRAEARARAEELARQITFEAATVAYFNSNEKKWKHPKHRAQFLTTLKVYAWPVLGQMSVGEIDTAAVLRAVQPLWLTKTETMSRVRSRIETILHYCTALGYRSGDNPAAWAAIGKVLPGRNSVAKVRNHPALPYSKLPAFMTELRQHTGVAARALEFTILCAARSNETIGACRNEIDFDAKVWTIPAERMKGGRDHRVPLSQPALDLLRGLFVEDGNAFVFVGGQKGRGISDTAMSRTLARLSPGVTVHGFRSTFSDWSHERTGFPNHVIEMSLAHAIGSSVEKAYRRGDLFDKRAALLRQWASYCAQPAGEAEVVPLRARP